MSHPSKKVKGPFLLESSKVVYENPWITVREDRVTRPGGSSGIFGIIDMVGGSSILPLDSDGFVYLVEEYKYGIDRVSVEVISGAIDGLETPLEAAERELEEELGMRAERWDDLGKVDPFTTVVHSPNFMFLARDLHRTEANPDEGEEVVPKRIRFEEALQQVLESKITHSASCVLILRAARLLGL
jgi:ADP-ribose pyrophosphatase